MSGGVGQCVSEEMRPDSGRDGSDHACGHAGGSCCGVEEEQTAEVLPTRRNRAEEGHGRFPGELEGDFEGRYDVWSRFARAHLSTEIERAAEAFAARPDVFAEAPASPRLPGPFPAPRTEDP